MIPRRLLPLFVLPFLASAASAQFGGTSALKGHDSNAPVDVAADRIELQDRQDRAVLSGNVRVTQGRMTLTSARAVVAYNRSGGGTEIQRLDATGNVVVQTPSETARGQFAIYDINRRLITLIGGVSLTRQGNRINGSRLVIDTNSGRATMDGSGVLGGGSGGRVTGQFTVPKRNDTPTPPTP